MAWARVRCEAGDGSVIEVEVGCDSPAYPDVLGQLRAEVARLWGEVAVEDG